MTSRQGVRPSPSRFGGSFVQVRCAIALAQRQRSEGLCPAAVDWFASFAHLHPEGPNALDAFDFDPQSVAARAVAASTMRDLAIRCEEPLQRALLGEAESLSELSDLEVLLQRSQDVDQSVRAEACRMLKDAWRCRGMAVIQELWACDGLWKVAAGEVASHLLALQDEEAKGINFSASFERTD